MNLFNARVVELRNAAEALLMNLCFTAGSITPEQFGEGKTEVPEGALAVLLGDRDIQREMDIKALLKSLGAIGGSNWVANLPREFEAICNVLRAHLRDRVADLRESEGLLRSDLSMIQKSLNARVSRVYPLQYTEPSRPWCLMSEAPPARFAAEALVRYLKFFTSNPELIKHEPLAECLYCEGIFLIQKSGQRFCTDKCRQRHWYSERGTEYYSPLQRTKRQKIRERRARKVQV